MRLPARLSCTYILGAGVDYWEEVPLEDGTVCFYNHTSQEYSSELPTIESATPIHESLAHPTSEHELQPAGTAESNNEGQAGMGEGQVWDGDDGEVFVPWPEEESQAMKTSPEAGRPSDEQPDTPEGEQTGTTKTTCFEKKDKIGYEHVRQIRAT